MGKGKRKPKETEYVTVRKNDLDRRTNLLINAGKGVGKVSEKDGNLVIRHGTESYGFVEYTLLNTSLEDVENTKARNHG